MRPMRISSLLPAASLALLLAAPGCETGFELPTHARVVTQVTAGSSGGVVKLITSSMFSADPGDPEGIELVVADTVLVAVPFDREIELAHHGGQRKLYVEVAPDDATELTVRMQVLIGGERWYDVTLPLPGYRHRFLYAAR